MPSNTKSIDNFVNNQAPEPQIQVEEFSYKTFNEIADYHDVRHVGDKGKELGEYAPKITEIGQVYLDHKMETVAGLGLVHRHFQLRAGELKVATQIGNSLVISARKQSGVHMQFLVPYFLKVTKNAAGNPVLVPLEYAEHKDNPVLFAKLTEAYKAIQNDAFLRSFIQVTEELGVSEYFGIVLSARDNIELKGDEGKVETGGCNTERKLLVRAVSKKDLDAKEDEFTQVCWQFETGIDGNVKPVGACLSAEHGPGDGANNKCRHCGCCNHCLHCSHDKEVNAN